MAVISRLMQACRPIYGSLVAVISRIQRMYRPFYASLAAGCLLTLVVLVVLQGTSVFQHAELSAYDQYFQLRGSISKPNDVVIVGVDTTSVSDLGDGRFPVQRRYMARAIDYLRKAHARLIVLDFEYLFPQSQIDDLALIRAVRAAGNVIVAGDIQYGTSHSNVGGFQSLDLPLTSISRAAAGVGMANLPVDDDGKLRSLQLFWPGPNPGSGGPVLYPSLVVKAASAYEHKPVSELVRGLPGLLPANFLGPQDPLDPAQTAFTYTQFEGIAGNPLQGLDDPRVFRNKAVFIVPYAIAFNDQHDTPFGQMYGGVIQATFFDTILRRDPISIVDDRANSLLILLLGLLTTLVSARFGLLRASLGAALLIVGYALVSIAIFITARTAIHVVGPETAAIFSFAGVMATRFSTEERQKRRTSRIFGEYVKPEIVHILVNTPDGETTLTGARRPLSVLFVDIRGFTRMSERMEPEDVVKTLDIYLEELSASVGAFDGTVDKYVGDELMAIWNAPQLQEDHALRAVHCALDMVSRTESINEQLRSCGFPAVRFGVGINSGEAVVGRMGSSLRKQYDVIGDTVNTAARLCSAAGGGEIIIGEETWNLTRDQVPVEETDPLTLKGKSGGFRTFRVIGPDDQPVPAVEAVTAEV